MNVAVCQQNFVYKIDNIQNNVGKIKKTQIELGEIKNNEVEISKGINNEDLIVLNHYEIRSPEQKIKL